MHITVEAVRAGSTVVPVFAVIDRQRCLMAFRIDEHYRSDVAGLRGGLDNHTCSVFAVSTYVGLRVGDILRLVGVGQGCLYPEPASFFKVARHCRTPLRRSRGCAGRHAVLNEGCCDPDTVCSVCSVHAVGPVQAVRTILHELARLAPLRGEYHVCCRGCNSRCGDYPAGPSVCCRNLLCPAGDGGEMVFDLCCVHRHFVPGCGGCRADQLMARY